MDMQFDLGDELRRLVESRIDRTLRGIEETLQRIMKEREIGQEDLRRDIQSLEESFSLLSQKWNLEILYILFLKNETGFSQLKKILGVNSRTLSDKLKSLATCEYVRRRVKTEAPVRVEYMLTVRGKNVVLLALPLLYYSRAHPLPQLGSKDDAGKQVHPRRT
jgi:DNA-binding HxlR family transcriptional regulator